MGNKGAWINWNFSLNLHSTVWVCQIHYNLWLSEVYVMRESWRHYSFAMTHFWICSGCIWEGPLTIRRVSYIFSQTTVESQINKLNMQCYYYSCTANESFHMFSHCWIYLVQILKCLSTCSVDWASPFFCIGRCTWILHNLLFSLRMWFHRPFRADDWLLYVVSSYISFPSAQLNGFLLFWFW